MLLNAPLIDIIKLLLSTLLMPLFFNIKNISHIFVTQNHIGLSSPTNEASAWFTSLHELDSI